MLGHVLLLAIATTASAAAPLAGMRAAIVGAGPSGLLLAHRLLESGASIHVFESRSDPRVDSAPEGRAYALGLGLRGRTAIRAADEALWQAVAAQGYASDRFTLHLPFGSFDLRTPSDKPSSQPSSEPRSGPSSEQEPSVLIYQTNLCAALLDALEDRYQPSGRLALTFATKVTDVDPVGGTVRQESSEESATKSFDMVAGCDGASSVVRAAMVSAARELQVETTQLPGSLKVVRLPKMPAVLSTDAVHLVPGVGGLAAFLEPTKGGVCALVSGPSLPGTTDAEEARELLASSFPTLADAFNTTDAGRQFVGQRPSTASTVRCSTYHVGRSVLLGDAAHSTGGASGQGCNSALQDAITLSECLERFRGEVSPALAAYSRERVPEGHALLDLSVGPGKEAGGLKRLLFRLSSVTDSLLAKVGLSDPPLQTLLTTTLKPFAKIRRERERLLGAFPSDEEFARSIDRASRYEE